MRSLGYIVIGDIKGQVKHIGYMSQQRDLFDSRASHSRGGSRILCGHHIMTPTNVLVWHPQLPLRGGEGYWALDTQNDVVPHTFTPRGLAVADHPA